MAIIFNHQTVAPEPAGAGAHRQHLLTAARVPATSSTIRIASGII